MSILFLLVTTLLITRVEPVREWHGMQIPAIAQIVLEQEPTMQQGTPTSLNISFAYLMLEDPNLMRGFHPGTEGVPSSPWEKCDVSAGTYLSKALSHNEVVFRETAWIDRTEKRIFGLTLFLEAEDILDSDQEFNVLLVYSDDRRTFELLDRAVCDPEHASRIAPRVVVRSSHYCDEELLEDEFDAEAWRSEDLELRGHMVADVICRGLILGLYRDEVHALLGPADIENGETLRYRFYRARKFWWEKWPPPEGIKFVENTYLFSIGANTDENYGTSIEVQAEYAK